MGRCKKSFHTVLGQILLRPDGCQRLWPNLDPENADVCGGCGCHASFHADSEDSRAEPIHSHPPLTASAQVARPNLNLNLTGQDHSPSIQKNQSRDHSDSRDEGDDESQSQSQTASLGAPRATASDVARPSSPPGDMADVPADGSELPAEGRQIPDDSSPGQIEGGTSKKASVPVDVRWAEKFSRLRKDHPQATFGECFLSLNEHSEGGSDIVCVTCNKLFPVGKANAFYSFARHLNTIQHHRLLNGHNYTANGAHVNPSNVPSLEKEEAEKEGGEDSESEPTDGGEVSQKRRQEEADNKPIRTQKPRKDGSSLSLGNDTNPMRQIPTVTRSGREASRLIKW